MPASVPIASLSDQISAWISAHGVAAVFVLMAVDALLPVGGELIMLLAGVLAAGVGGYLALATGGTVGYLAGALVGWEIGRRGGRALIGRQGARLRVSPESYTRAEAWFDRHGSAAVLLGRLTPLVRSFVSIPAGMLGVPLARYVLLTLVGSAIWCFGFAAAGYAAAGSWRAIHADVRYAELAVLAVILVTGARLWRQRRRAVVSRNG
ncbi:MAG TPA: DedA family protein [Solirubrobacteraceae bacterium]|nr:DedA family protein [Solirubrobacteraceae bacterium]